MTRTYPGCLLPVRVSPEIEDLLPKHWVPGEGVEPFSPSRTIEKSYRNCRKVTRHHAKSFYFSSFTLPRAKRMAAYAIYAFCRHVDDCIDEAPPEETPPKSLLLDEARAILEGASPLPFAPAFSEVVRHFRIPFQLIEDLIEGCCRDRISPVRMPDFRALEEYCYYVASVVGLLMCPVFGLRGREALPQAVDMGIAMQLTNILRDVREDLEKDRIYLPASELELAGIDLPSLIRQGAANDPWRRFMTGQIERTRDYYRRGEKGLRHLENDGSRTTARVMARVYGGILDEIEGSGYENLKTRHYVSLPRKIRILLRCLTRRHPAPDIP